MWLWAGGPIVNEADLVAALQSGTIAGMSRSYRPIMDNLMPGASSDEKMEECFRLATTTYPDAKYIVFQENMRGACLTLIATEGLGVPGCGFSGYSGRSQGIYVPEGTQAPGSLDSVHAAESGGD